MAKNIKRMFALVIAVVMVFGLSVSALATDEAETTYVACIGTQGYESLSAAVAAANASESGAIITLLANTSLAKKLDIKKNVTIEGAYTITRATAGTMFAVAKNATLTLDGGVVIDGGNNWTFDSTGFYGDMAAGLTLSTGAKSSYTTSAEGGILATSQMITISDKGTVVMNNATIQNSWADNHNTGALFKVPAGATLIMNDGSVINHIRSSVAGQVYGAWTVNGGLINDVYGHNANGGLVDLRTNGVLTVNGGDFTNIRNLGLNANGNGIIVQSYGEGTRVYINGGHFYNNASFSPGGGWGSQFYMNRGGDLIMTAGTIEATLSDKCSAFVANTATSVQLVGGIIKVDASTAAGFDSLFYGDVTVSEGMQIIGAEDAHFVTLGDIDNPDTPAVEQTNYLVINGAISGGTIELHHSTPITGSGTVTSDVLVIASDYLEHDGKVIISEANWLNSIITVNSIGTDASLTVQDGAVIDGIQVRVLESVAGADYTNASESADAQETAYSQSAGATVASPVLYYHRLTADQKKDITVTYDYNGGLDAQGWSGCQITAEGEVFSIETLPAPTKDGYIFAGWNYASDNEPESLSMAGSVAFDGEDITQNVRLIAQWEIFVPTYTVTYMTESGAVVQLFTNLKTGDSIPVCTVPVSYVVGGYNYYVAYWNVSGEVGADGKIGTSDLVYVAVMRSDKISDNTGFVPESPTYIVDKVALAAVPSVFSEDHFAYVVGYPNGSVMPEGKITRAEVATIFFRLLSDEVREMMFCEENDFSDVNNGSWYNNAVSTMAAMGIVEGYPDGTFRPNDYITRAEFAAIVARFEVAGNSEGNFFNDTDGHWAEELINIAANNGWVNGYPDGSFCPNNYITRAEAMTLVNRVLHRIPEFDTDLLNGMVEWSDNMDKKMWYYLAIQEATNSHDYELKENPMYETWVEMLENRDWTELEY